MRRSQVSVVQGSPSSQSSATPAPQRPAASQLDAVVQGLASSQPLPSAGGPEMQMLPAAQVSPAVHSLPSLHDAPIAGQVATSAGATEKSELASVWLWPCTARTLAPGTKRSR